MSIYVETWLWSRGPLGHGTFCRVEDGPDIGLLDDDDAGAVGRSRLMLAAPRLVQALLLAEWEEARGCDDFEGMCSLCKSTRSMPHNECAVDDALTAVGLDTQEKRDAVRAELQAAGRGEEG